MNPPNDILEYVAYRSGCLGEYQTLILLDFSVGDRKKDWDYEGDSIEDIFVRKNGERVYLLLRYDYD